MAAQACLPAKEGDCLGMIDACQLRFGAREIRGVFRAFKLASGFLNKRLSSSRMRTFLFPIVSCIQKQSSNDFAEVL